jgi:hypothetical protein
MTLRPGRAGGRVKCTGKASGGFFTRCYQYKHRLEIRVAVTADSIRRFSATFSGTDPLAGATKPPRGLHSGTL